MVEREEIELFARESVSPVTSYQPLLGQYTMASYVARLDTSRIEILFTRNSSLYQITHIITWGRVSWYHSSFLVLNMTFRFSTNEGQCWSICANDGQWRHTLFKYNYDIPCSCEWGLHRERVHWKQSFARGSSVYRNSAKHGHGRYISVRRVFSLAIIGSMAANLPGGCHHLPLPQKLEVCVDGQLTTPRWQHASDNLD